MPDEIHIPSTMSLDMSWITRKELPMDLITDLKLKKYDPYSLSVPCVNGFGSCAYDGCRTLDKLCKVLPPDVPCHCPLPAGNYTFNDVQMKVKDMGPLMDKLMEGSYTG